MSVHESVPMDAATEIRELDADGFGRNAISSITGVNASTVRNILEGKHQTFCSKLTPRQTSQLIRGFGGGR